MSNSTACKDANLGGPTWFSSYSGAVCHIPVPVANTTEITTSFSTCCALTLNSTTRYTPTNWTTISSKPGVTFGETKGQNDCPFLYCDVTYANTTQPQSDAMAVFKKCLNDAAPQTISMYGCVSTTGSPATKSGGVVVTAVSKTGLVLFLMGVVALVV